VPALTSTCSTALLQVLLPHTPKPRACAYLQHRHPKPRAPGEDVKMAWAGARGGYIIKPLVL